MLRIKTNQTPLIREMDLFKELRWKRLFSINGLNKSFLRLQGCTGWSESSGCTCHGLHEQKCVFRHMLTAKTQIRLRIRAVWSGPLLSANRIIGHFRIYLWRENARMRLCACVGWIWICTFWAYSDSLSLGSTRMVQFLRLGLTC